MKEDLLIIYIIFGDIINGGEMMLYLKKGEQKMMIYDNPNYNIWIIDGKKVRIGGKENQKQGEEDKEE